MCVCVSVFLWGVGWGWEMNKEMSLLKNSQVGKFDYLSHLEHPEEQEDGGS